MAITTRTQTLTKQVLLRCYPAEREALEQFARASNLSLSALVRRVITDWLAENKLAENEPKKARKRSA